MNLEITEEERQLIIGGLLTGYEQVNQHTNTGIAMDMAFESPININSRSLSRADAYRNLLKKLGVGVENNK